MVKQCTLGEPTFHFLTNLLHEKQKDARPAGSLFLAGLPRAKRAWDRAPYSWNMVNLFSFGCHVIDRAYVRTYASTDCTGGVGETIKRKEGVSWRVHIFNIAF